MLKNYKFGVAYASHHHDFRSCSSPLIQSHWGLKAPMWRGEEDVLGNFRHFLYLLYFILLSDKGKTRYDFFKCGHKFVPSLKVYFQGVADPDSVAHAMSLEICYMLDIKLGSITGETKGLGIKYSGL